MKKRPGQQAEPQRKHLRVRNSLRKALSDGEFKPGCLLPGERLLAERFGVSYMTARRAIEALVAEGLCERQGKRTLVSADALRLAGSVRLNLLCSKINTFSEPLLRAVEEEARRHGWVTQLIILHGANDPLGLRALASGEPCLLLLPEDVLLGGKIGRMLSEARGPVVIVGNCPAAECVPWVKADDRAGMRMAIDHLRQLGHKAILFVHDDIGHQGVADCLDEWLQHAKEQKSANPRPPLCVVTESHESRPRIAREAIKRYLGDHPRPSAIICDNDELALGVLHGLRDLGMEVPGDVSMVSIGDTVLAEYCVPSLSVVDVHFERHIRVATDLIADSLQGRKLGGEGHVIRPRFLHRESTAPLRGKSRS